MKISHYCCGFVGAPKLVLYLENNPSSLDSSSDSRSISFSISWFRSTSARLSRPGRLSLPQTHPLFYQQRLYQKAPAGRGDRPRHGRNPTRLQSRSAKTPSPTRPNQPHGA